LKLLFESELRSQIDIEAPWDDPTLIDYMTAGSTAIALAARHGYHETVKLLFDYGADPNHLNFFRASPLFLAAERGYSKVVSVLLDVGAKTHATVPGQVTALEAAAWAGHHDTAELIRPHTEASPRWLKHEPKPLKGSKRNATATLIRASKDKEHGYDAVLARTAAIAEADWAKDVDHIIFHEEDLALAHQEWIQTRSALPLVFIDVSRSFKHAKTKFYEARARHEKGSVNQNCPLMIPGHLRYGYQAMCWFWFYDMLTYVADHYHVILRVDDDCILLKSEAGAPWLSDGEVFGSPEWQGKELETGLSGMRELFEAIAIERHREGSLAADGSSAMSHPKLWKPNTTWRSPYTNVMAVDVQWAANDPTLKRVFKAVEKSGCVWSTAWGDLQLWGAALKLVKKSILGRVPAIQAYYHGSHARSVVSGVDGGIAISKFTQHNLPGAPPVDELPPNDYMKYKTAGMSPATLEGYE